GNTKDNIGRRHIMTSFATTRISDAHHSNHNLQISNSTPLPIDIRPRQERRPEIIKLEKKKRKLARQIGAVNLQVDFDNDTVTAFGGWFTFV
ncbi:MAG: hypothetical protein QME42_11900, partial [bacterium]|nr:hypothetical protein [bacterium]